MALTHSSVDFGATRSPFSLGIWNRTLCLGLSVVLAGCGLDPTTAGGPQGTPTPTQPKTTEPSDSSSTQAKTEATSTPSQNNTGSGPRLECVGLYPEGEPEEEGSSEELTIQGPGNLALQTGPGTQTLSTQSPSGTATTSSTTSTTTRTGGETGSSSTASGSSSTRSGSTSSDEGGTGTGSETGSGTETGSDTGTDSTGEGGCVHPACIGDESVSWQLHDHQPRSCGFGQDYGQDVYFGKTTMVVFLAGWCGFCLRQTVKLEKMRIEWEREGKDIHILIVNASSANNMEYRNDLVSRTSNPVFQDTSFADVWGAMRGVKDTFYIYDAKGILREYLLPGGDVNIDLSSPEGYDGVKKRAEMVLANQE